MKELVSVIIPYYKKKKFFKKSINSVLNQTHKKIEIIVVYDDENTLDLNYIKKICKKDTRIKLYINRKNIGAGFSRNYGIKKSKGQYIAFLDADDLWLKNKIKEQLYFMKKKKIYLSHTSYHIISEIGIFVNSRSAKNLSFKNLINSCDICLSTVMINSKFLKRSKCLFANLKTKEDFVLWLKLLKKTPYFYGLEKKLTNWTDSKNSLSSNSMQKIYDGYKVYRYYMKYSVFMSLYKLFILSLNYIWKKFFL